MAWIESHQGLARHIKTKRLARKLDVSVPAAIGHLHLLWWWSMDNTPDGNLSQLEPEDIADEMMWNGDSDVLVRGLVDSGFVDEVEGSLVIHDFYDYVGKLVDKRKADAERKRSERSKSKGNKEDVQEMSDGQGSDDPSDGAGNSTVPNSTVPKEEIPYVEIINYLNEVCGSKFSHKGKETVKLINGRWNEGRRFEDFKYVIDVKAKEWLSTEHEQYLRPTTLFLPSKFESYLNQKAKVKMGKHNKQNQFNGWETPI